MRIEAASNESLKTVSDELSRLAGLSDWRDHQKLLDRMIQMSSLFVDRFHLNIDYCNDCYLCLFESADTDRIFESDNFRCQYTEKIRRCVSFVIETFSSFLNIEYACDNQISKSKIP